MKDKITEYFRKNWKVIAIASVILLFIGLFRSFFFAGLLFGFTIFISWLANKTKMKLFGIEFVTFTTVIIGYSYGPIWGGIVGLLLEGINSFIVSRWARAYNLWVIPSFGLAGIIAGLRFGLSFVILGIGIVIGLHVIYVGISLLTAGKLHPKYILYAVPNVLFNIIIFTSFGKIILGIIG